MDAASFKKQQKAAALIQAHFRGYLARKRFKKLKNATRTIQAHAKGWYTRKKVFQAKERLALEAKFQTTMSRHKDRIYVLERHKRDIQEQPSEHIEIWQSKRIQAAIKVQAAWRGHVARRRYAALEQERIGKGMAGHQMHKAFKNILAEAQAAHAQQVAASTDSWRSGFVARSTNRSEPLSPALRQSATVLMGSPEKGVELQGGVATSQGHQHWHMSAKRYAELTKQVEERVKAHQALAKHRRPDTHTTDARLKRLLHEYQSSAAERLRAAHARANQLVALEFVANSLDNGGLRPLSELKDPDPIDYPRPARGSERWERGMQAHACELADARAGPAWWRHLQPLNRSNLQQALLQEDVDRWQELDGIWRRLWARAEGTEAQRPDPLAELRIKAPGAPKPKLSDLADYDQDYHDKQDQLRKSQPDACNVSLPYNRTHDQLVVGPARQSNCRQHTEGVGVNEPMQHGNVAGQQVPAVQERTRVETRVVTGALGQFVTPV